MTPCRRWFAAGAALLWVSGASAADYTVSEYAYRRLERAQKALESKDTPGALAALNELAERRTLSGYERALMWQTFAYVYVTASDLSKAVEAFAATLALHALPPEAQLSMMFNLGQVYLSIERPRDAAQILEQWAAEVPSPSPEALYAVAFAHAQNKDLDAALRHIDRAIGGLRSAPDSWWELKAVAHVNRKQWGEAIRVMIRLVERDLTSETRWKQLSALYAEAGKLDESIAVLELAFDQGLLRRPNDVHLLVQNLAAAGVPASAARYMEEALAVGVLSRNVEELTSLGRAYVAAREIDEAIVPFRAAAAQSSQGDMFVELGRLYMLEKKWDEAAAAFGRALGAPGLRQPGQVHLMQGMAYHRLDRVGPARRAFMQAVAYEDSRSSGQNWLDYLGPQKP